MEIEASDATFYVRCGSGNLQGDGLAAWQFTVVYHPVIYQWHQRVRDTSLQVTDPISLRSVPVDLSSYADDVDLVQVRSIPTAIAERVNFSNEVFSSVLASMGSAQNVGKQDHIVCYKGAHSCQAYRDTLPVLSASR